MSFRHKLSIAFFLVLFLSVIVSMTSWLGMRNAIESQKNMYLFQNHIERTFHEMSQQEQAFTAEETISHSRLVFNHIQEMREQLAGDALQTGNIQHRQQLAVVLETIDSYETTFSRYVQQNLNMQTIRSRLGKEAERLNVRVDEIVGDTPLGQDMYRLATGALLTQKEFSLSPQPKTGRQFTSSIDKIHELALSLRSQQQADSLKLQVFRVDKSATAFADSFRQFASQLEIVEAAHRGLRQAFTELRAEINSTIAIDAELANKRILFLQALIITAALLAILFSIVATLLLSEFITRPIELLKASAREIVSGDLNTSVQINSRDEIGELGQLFNEMTEKLRGNFHELERYRDKLEVLVRERTHELELEVSERRETERELIASEKRLRTFFDNSAEGILITDPETHQFILANRTIGEMLGYTVNELLSLTVQDIHPPEELAATLGEFREMREGKSDIAKDIPVLRKDGSIFPAEISATVIDIGNQQYMLGYFRDISERKAVEAERLKVRKLESVGLLAGGIAHDFNNILAAILGNASLALALTDQHDRRFKLLRALEHASLRARDLTQQLLTFSKGGEPVKELTSLTDIIRESASFVLRGSNVRYDFAFTDNLWNAEVDAGQISRVIQNIVVNAKQAMPDGGIITIGCRNVIPSPQLSAILADKHCLEIRITDNGPGIPENLLEQIFDPYFTTKTEGSGLGLAITHSIVSKHNGAIAVSSPPGRGATFRILLPAVDDRLPESGSGDRPKHHPGSGTIMIMDDEQAVREVTEQILKYLGYSAIPVADGEGALRIYQQRLVTDQPVDLIIMDLTIPGGMGGRETAEKILLLDSEARLIVSSGYSQDPIMANYSDFGFKGFLSKPYQLHDLQLVLQQTLAPERRKLKNYSPENT